MWRSLSEITFTFCGDVIFSLASVCCVSSIVRDVLASHLPSDIVSLIALFSLAFTLACHPFPSVAHSIDSPGFLDHVHVCEDDRRCRQHTLRISE